MVEVVRVEWSVGVFDWFSFKSDSSRLDGHVKSLLDKRGHLQPSSIFRTFESPSLGGVPINTIVG